MGDSHDPRAVPESRAAELAPTRAQLLVGEDPDGSGRNLLVRSARLRYMRVSTMGSTTLLLAVAPTGCGQYAISAPQSADRPRNIVLRPGERLTVKFPYFCA